MKPRPNPFEDELNDEALVLMPDEGEGYKAHGMSIRFKVTSENTQGQMGIYEICLAPKTIGAKPHYHRFMDETFIVQEGSVTLSLGKRSLVVTKGAIVHVPRFTPHGFRNDSDQAVKLILIFSPGQNRESFFIGLHETLTEHPVNPQKFLALYEKYDSIPINVNDFVQVSS